MKLQSSRHQIRNWTVFATMCSLSFFLFWIGNRNWDANQHRQLSEFRGVDRVREIFELYGDDKLGHKMYSIMYSKYLKDVIYTKENFRMLEIGVGCINEFSYGKNMQGKYTEGRSVKVWKHLLPKADIYVLDIDPCAKRIASAGVLAEDHIIIGSQVDQGILNGIVDIGPFDMIVDDGSHVPKHQIKTFAELFCKSLAPGGVYVIEDLESSVSDTLITKFSTFDMLTEASVALTANGNIAQNLRSRRLVKTSYSFLATMTSCIESIDWFEDAVVIKRRSV